MKWINKKATVLFSALAMALLTLATGHAVSTALGEPSLAEKIVGADTELQAQGVREVLKNRQETISELVLFLETVNRNETETPIASIVAAITVLGEMRATSAASVLAAYLDFRGAQGIDDSPLNRLVPPSEDFPAVKALINIGRPSIPHVINAVMSDEDNEVLLLRNCAWVITQIEGGDSSGFMAARFHLKLLLDTERDPKRKLVIEKLLNMPGLKEEF